MPKSHPMLKALRDATRGLRYVSEADATFEPFVWPGTGGPADEAAVLAKSGAGGAVARSSLVDFFRAVPQGEKGKYLTLAATLADSLRDVRVFKVGEGRVSIYVLGTTDDGKWAGVKTEAVET
jgi:hypothetical protein